MQASSEENGAVMVEFALVLVPLLFLVFGFLHFGLAMNAKIDSTHLSAEGARYVAVNQNPGLSDPSLLPPNNTMVGYIKSRGDTGAVKNGTVTICYPTNPATGTAGKVGDPVTVKVSPTTYTPLAGPLPLIGSGGPLTLPSLSVTSSTTMRLEAAPTNIPQAGPCP